MNAKGVDIENWIKTQIKQDEIEKYLNNGKDFICDKEIVSKIDKNKKIDKSRIKDILDKSLSIEILTPDETALLLNVTCPDILAQMQETALKVKKKVYDNRIITFAPLYTGNFCVNNCLYCGFRQGNDSAVRKILSLEDIRKEIETLAGKIGHKRLIVVYGEHPLSDIDYMISSIKEIYDVKVKNDLPGIRRVNVNAPPLCIEDLKKLKKVGIGTYQVFQETYHRDTYNKVHPKGTIKSNYLWRLYSMHRAFDAGIDDMGIGVLLGLYDWKFEVMGLLYHAIELEKKFKVGPHTVSFPRLEPALNTPFNKDFRYKVSDDDFKRIVTVIRLAIPYTGMILTARETPEIRREVLDLGITQIDASTKIGIGSYKESGTEQEQDRQQFLLGDTRNLDQVIKELAEKDSIMSFCTAGYRCGRTGERIMSFLKNGKEGNFCKLNAIITYREWLDDFATEDTKKIALEVLNREIEEVKKEMPFVYAEFMDYYERTKKGERDLYF